MKGRAETSPVFIRTTVETHRAAAKAAAGQGITLTSWVENLLAREVGVSDVSPSRPRSATAANSEATVIFVRTSDQLRRAVRAAAEAAGQTISVWADALIVRELKTRKRSR